MASIVNIPAEVLDDILHLVVFGVLLRWHDLWQHRLTLACVCSTFKNVIYGAPRYWSRLFVHRYTRRGYLEFCLRQTGSAALLLWVDSEKPPNPYAYDHALRRAPLSHFITGLRLHIRPFFHRVARLQIRGARQEDHVATVAELAKYEASSLTHLYLQFDSRYRTLTTDYSPFASHQRLSFLVLSCTFPITPHTSYAAVTTLVLRLLWLKHAPRWAEVRSVLVCMDHLEELQLDHVECVGMTDAPRLRMESLTSLVLQCDSEASIQLVALLDMPHVSSWELTLYDGASLSTLVEAGGSAFQRATRLRLDVEVLGYDDIPSLFRASTSIRDVDFSLSSKDVCDHIGHWAVTLPVRWHHMKITGPMAQSRAEAMVRALGDEGGGDVELTIYGREGETVRSVWTMLDGVPVEKELEGGRFIVPHRFSIDDRVKF
ncbi:hypothetical protein B0H15DRAFT_946848 [Mycena belliarum]|uniref:F-box domain-containing protein n=1 Tax=Mycena belliarum TaxID=1033014 RepID=A0AAD6XUQ2_9AGAR|nr:hypothetical protein B0H15DRAFT_946848 [Mycena belliae]